MGYINTLLYSMSPPMQTYSYIPYTAVYIFCYHLQCQNITYVYLALSAFSSIISKSTKQFKSLQQSYPVYCNILISICAVYKKQAKWSFTYFGEFCQKLSKSVEEASREIYMYYVRTMATIPVVWGGGAQREIVANRNTSAILPSPPIGRGHPLPPPPPPTSEKLMIHHKLLYRFHLHGYITVEMQCTYLYDKLYG